ncbi:MAG: DUF4115 domain-containing protein [Streptosporangiaceae bacterium]
MGDGRHRADPKGHGRYVIAGLGILIVVMLILAGGYALYGALMAKPGETTFSSEPARHTGGGRVLDTTGLPSRDATLTLNVTGDRCFVSVHVPDGKTLLNKTLKKGDHVAFDQPKLVVTVGNSAAVDVRVNGKPYHTRKGAQVEAFTVTSGH